MFFRLFQVSMGMLLYRNILLNRARARWIKSISSSLWKNWLLNFRTKWILKEWWRRLVMIIKVNVQKFSDLRDNIRFLIGDSESVSNDAKVIEWQDKEIVPKWFRRAASMMTENKSVQLQEAFHPDEHENIFNAEF